MSKLPARIQSIDVFRAITMFLMIFVNDVAGVKDIPAWIEHTAAETDGMGFSDVIFPAFLFIVGLSLPFALQNRIKKGSSRLTLSGYIFLRAAALIIMGFFHVNLESYDQQAALLPYPVYTILITISFFLIWLDYPEGLRKVKKYMLIASGIVLLIVLAFLYKGDNNGEAVGLKPHWWGILGIIGWAYLVSAHVYLLTKGKTWLLLPSLLIFACINVGTHMGFIHIKSWLIGDASSITLMVGGAFISSLYRHLAARDKESALWLFLTISVVICVFFGFLIRPYSGGISKIYATPAWVFICMGISLFVFGLLIYIVDLRGKKDWFKWIKPAGTSTLTCYLIPYLLYSLFWLVHFHFPRFLNHGLPGMLRSACIAALVIWIVSFLEKKHLRLKI